MRAGVHLEALWSIHDTGALDQTSTVRFGDLRVTTVYPVAGVSVREVLEAASIAECRSEHPIGRAIIKYAAEKRIPQHEPKGFRDTPGEGVRALEALRRFSSVVAALSPPAGFRNRRATEVARRPCLWNAARPIPGSVAVASMPRPDAKRGIPARFRGRWRSRLTCSRAMLEPRRSEWPAS